MRLKTKTLSRRSFAPKPLKIEVGQKIRSKFDDRLHQVTKILKDKVFFSENSDGTGEIHSETNAVILECFFVEKQNNDLPASEKIEKKSLFLILQGIYFDPIISGEKTIEYREASPHNISRLCTKDKLGKIDGFRNYETVIFQAGYNKDAKRLTAEVKMMTYDGGVIEIHLGKVLEMNFVQEQLEPKNPKKKPLKKLPKGVIYSDDAKDLKGQTITFNYVLE